MECAFQSQSRCKSLLRIDADSTKVQVGITRRLSLDEEAPFLWIERLPQHFMLEHKLNLAVELCKDWSKLIIQLLGLFIGFYAVLESP